MRPRVAHLSKFCVLDEIFARFSQDAQVNETLINIMRQCSDFYFLSYLSPHCLASSRDLLEQKVEISSHSQVVLKNDWCMTRRAGLYM